jgi:hypothetical protein
VAKACMVALMKPSDVPESTFFYVVIALSMGGLAVLAVMLSLELP